MVWQSGSENEEYSDKPYSTLSGGKPLRFMARTEFPFILVGAGLLLLLVLFLVFFSGNDHSDDERVSNISTRLNRIENRLAALDDMEQQLDSLQVLANQLEQGASGDQQKVSPDPRFIDQLQSNTEALQEISNTLEKTADRLNLLENRLNRMEKKIQAVSAARVKTPTTGASSSKTGFYVVKEGDTLYSIAKNNQVELDRFLEINGLKEDSVIYPGQKLKVPASN